jgi:hypothetical protein
MYFWLPEKKRPDFRSKKPLEFIKKTGSGRADFRRKKRRRADPPGGNSSN